MLASLASLKDRVENLLLSIHNTAHEACHYLAARLLGYEARFRGFYVTFYPDEIDWRVFVVLLAPAMVGLAVLAFGAWVALQERAPIVVLLALGFNLPWQLCCIEDYYHLWHFWRHGEFPEDAWQAPGTQQTVGDFFRGN